MFFVAAGTHCICCLRVYSMSEKDKDDLEEEEENLSHNGACVFV